MRWHDGDPCPLLGRTTPHIGGRSLFLRQRGRLTLFKTDTRDFADSEILECQREDGQIYVDISDKPAPDDFARDLRKLTLLEECSSCPENTRCAMSYRIDPTDVFDRDEAILIETLNSLRGSILDIGCGAGRYIEALRPAIEDGRIQYTGIDPDSSALEALARSHRTARPMQARSRISRWIPSRGITFLFCRVGIISSILFRP